MMLFIYDRVSHTIAPHSLLHIIDEKHLAGRTDRTSGVNSCWRHSFQLKRAVRLATGSKVRFVDDSGGTVLHGCLSLA
jgi:hypothetical protein